MSRFACAEIIAVVAGLDAPWPDLPALEWLLDDLRRLETPLAGLSYLPADVARLRGRLAACPPDSLVLVLGGLGTGADNVTRPAVAGALSRDLHRSPALEERLRAEFNRRQVRVPESHWCLAETLEGADLLIHDASAEVGWRLAVDDRLVVALPGDLAVARALWCERLRPELERVMPPRLAQATRVVKLVGLPLAEARRRLGPLLAATNPAATLVERGPEVHLRLVAEAPWGAAQRGRPLRLQPGVDPIRPRHGPAAAAEELLDLFESRVRALMPYHVYGSDAQSLAAVVADMLYLQEARLALADALTAGAASGAFQTLGERDTVLAGALVASLPSLATVLGAGESARIDETFAKRLAALVRTRFAAEVGLALCPAPDGRTLLAADQRGRVRVEEHRWSEAEAAERGVPWALNLVRKVLLPALDCC